MIVWVNVVLLLTMTDVSTNCAVVIFRVNVIDLISQLSRDELLSHIFEVATFSFDFLVIIL